MPFVSLVVIPGDAAMFCGSGELVVDMVRDLGGFISRDAPERAKVGIHRDRSRKCDGLFEIALGTAVSHVTQCINADTLVRHANDHVR